MDGQRLLIDPGARSEVVLRNASELGVDLTTVTDLVITHNHADHTGVCLTREAAAVPGVGATHLRHGSRPDHPGALTASRR